MKLVLYRDYIVIHRGMEKTLETSIIHWDYVKNHHIKELYKETPVLLKPRSFNLRVMRASWAKS